MKNIRILALLILAFIAQTVVAHSETGLTFYSPEMNTGLPLGKKRVIEWISYGMTKGVTIFLTKGGSSSVFVIKGKIQSMDGINSFEWKVGELEDGTSVKAGRYKMVVKSLDSSCQHLTAASCEYSVPFDISNSKIYFESPEIFATLPLQSQQQITWHSPGTDKYAQYKIYIAIIRQGVLFHYPDLTTTHTKASPVYANTGSLDWTVGSVFHTGGTPPVEYQSKYPPGKYFLGIYNSNYQGLDMIPITIGKQIHAELTAEVGNAYFGRLHVSYGFPPFSCWYTNGWGPVEIPSGQMWVGYDNYYDDGLICWQYIGHVYRGITDFVKPDPKVMGKIEKATLTLVKKSTVKSIGSTASNAGSCAVAMHILDAPFGDFFNTPMHHYADLPQDGPASNEKVSFDGTNLKIDVTDIVKYWMNNGKNYGFVFTEPAGGLSENNDKCYSFYEVGKLIIDAIDE
jgi:hypothetical protein